MEIDDHLAVMITRCALSVGGLLASVLPTAFILARKKLRNQPHHFLLILLFIGGFFLSLGAAMRVATQLIWKPNYQRRVCLAMNSVELYGNFVTEIAVLLITVDRFWMVKKIQKLRERDGCLYVFAVLATLTVSLIPVGLVFLEVRDEEVVRCHFSWSPAFGTFMFYKTAVLNTAIIGLYLAITCMYKLKTNKVNTQVAVLGPQKSGKEKRFFLNIYGLLTAFVLTWSAPKLAMFVAFEFKVGSDLLDLFQLISSLGNPVNPIINFVFYCITNREFRSEFQKTWKGDNTVIYVWNSKIAAVQNQIAGTSVTRCINGFELIGKSPHLRISIYLDGLNAAFCCLQHQSTFI